MIGNIGTVELVIVLVIAIMIFGPSRIPKLAQSVGETIKAFRNGSREAGHNK